MKKAKEKPIRQNISFGSDDFRIEILSGKATRQETAFHETLEIKYFYEGEATLLLGSDIVVARSGDITVANPYEIHTNIISDSQESRYYLLMIDLDFFADNGIGDIDLRQILLARGHRFNRLIRDNKRLQELIVRAFEELQDKKVYYRTVVKNLLCEFFVIMLRDELSDDAPQEHNPDKIRRHGVISPALHKIFTDYAKRLTIDELAGLCNISKYHFCRIFKEELGVTPVQYIMNYRISLAETMLKNEKQSIGTVARLCGFEDVSYFYRCYKKLKGTSPNKSRLS